MSWVRENGTTLVGWLVVVSLALGARMADMDATAQSQQVTRLEVADVKTRVTAVESDVRLLEHSVKRQEKIVTRQEAAQRELDRLVIELRAVMERP